jgi:DNA repair photolyase
VYCYASAGTDAQPSIDVEAFKKELSWSEPWPVRIGTNSDPYPQVERAHRITRACIDIINEYQRPIEVVTKSDLVLDDKDRLGNAVVEVSVNTIDERISRKFEPCAPSPLERIDALQQLSEHGIRTTARLDPIIPGYIGQKEIDDLLDSLQRAGVEHAIAKFLQLTDALFPVFDRVDPSLSALYRERGKRQGSYILLPVEDRRPLMEHVRDGCAQRGIVLSVCREPDLSSLSNGPCDLELFAIKQRLATSGPGPEAGKNRRS